MANRNGLFADFSPKPVKNAPGNGFHINFSVKDKNGKEVSSNCIAGILNRIEDCTVFFNNTEESYKRLGSNKAPAFISWSKENRSELIRIPAAFGEFKRAELRSPDPLANPYIAFALMIYAAVGGVVNGEILPPAADFNLYKADAETLSKFKKLPTSRRQAKSGGKSIYRKIFAEVNSFGVYEISKKEIYVIKRTRLQRSYRFGFREF